MTGCDWCTDGLQADGTTPCPCTHDTGDALAEVVAMQTDLIGQLQAQLAAKDAFIHNLEVYRMAQEAKARVFAK